MYFIISLVPKLTIQANVTLTALNGDADIVERFLTLDPINHMRQIGRASKTPSKGLQAAIDNAWFDSPVMSRNHAEVFLNDNKVSRIQSGRSVSTDFGLGLYQGYRIDAWNFSKRHSACSASTRGVEQWR